MDTFNTGGHPHYDSLQNINDTTAISHWYPVQINFTSIAAVNNNANFTVRMMTAGSNNLTGSGNLRLDNIALMGDTDITTSVNETAAFSAGYSVYPNPVRNIVHLVSEKYTGSKVMTIYNLVGQEISVTENSDKQTSINTSALSSGIYLLEIKEEGTGNTYTVKIVKE
jgi:hypothetical protein